MADPPRPPQAATASELKAQIEAEREGLPFLIFRDGDEHHQILVLDDQAERLSIGRRSSADVALTWDEGVSRLHAELRRHGEDWTLVDDGLSMNGSFVNGEPVRGQRRLHDGDALRLGDAVLVFRRPTEAESLGTAPMADLHRIVSLSETQRKVLIALCRPFKNSTAFVTPRDQRRDRRRALPQRGRGQEAHAGAVREVRRRAPPTEREARPPGGARLRRRPHLRARAVERAPPPRCGSAAPRGAPGGALVS